MGARSNNFRGGAALVTLVAITWVCAGEAPSGADFPLLTNAAQLRQLTAAEARRGYPVRVRGVSTFYHAGENELFLQDESGGVLVRAGEHFGFELGVGQLLQAEGRTQPGTTAAELKSTRLLLIGEGPSPTACRITESQLAAGEPDSCWVEISGVVHRFEVGRADALLGIEVETSRGPVLALVKDYNLEESRTLIDAEVAITGVLRRTAAGQIELRVPAIGDLRLAKPARADPFGSPLHPIASLRALTAGTKPVHRIRVLGIVTLHQAGRVFVQQNSDNLAILTDWKAQLHPGDLVEAVGFPALSRTASPMLEHSVVHRVGKGPAPTPLSVSAAEAVTLAREGSLLSIEAALLGRQSAPARTLQLESSNVLFSAHLQDQERDFPGWFREGSRVRVTGICLPLPGSPDSQPAFDLLLRSPADVVPVGTASSGKATWLLWAAVAAIVFAGSFIVRQRKNP